jgi:hypothetical protein
MAEERFDVEGEDDDGQRQRRSIARPHRMHDTGESGNRRRLRPVRQVSVVVG